MIKMESHVVHTGMLAEIANLFFSSIARSVGLTILFLFFLTLLAYGQQITVAKDGSGDYSSIQTAIDAANSGDTVHVKAGTYEEHIVVKDRIQLQGAGRDVVSVKGVERGKPVIRVEGEAKVLIAGFTITGAKLGSPRTNKEDGIWIGSTGDVVIKNSNLTSNAENGIEVDESSEASVTIENCEISNNGSHGNWVPGALGIWVGGSGHVSIVDNRITQNANMGINTNSTSNVTIAHNTISNTKAEKEDWSGIGIRLTDSTSIAIYDNAINDNADAGIAVTDESQALLLNNDLNTNTSHGVIVWSSKAEVIGNTITDTRPKRGGSFGRGIALQGNAEVTIKENTIMDNADWGVILGASSHVVMQDNILAANGGGVRIGFDNADRETVQVEISQNTIRNNEGCGIDIEPDEPSLDMTGSSNVISGNHPDLCGDLDKLPEGFLLPSNESILFQDDFNNPSSWLVDSNEKVEFTYEDGEYSILAKMPNSWWWAGSPVSEPYSDFVVEIDVKQVVGGIEDHYGIVFRYQEINGMGNYYRFGISGAGEYALFQAQDDRWTTLIDWTKSDAIRSGSNHNHLKVIAKESQISVYANGEFLASIDDSSFTQGAIGLYAEEAGERNVHAHFDNFIVRTAPTNLEPSAQFDYSPFFPKVNETVNFDASASSDPDGSIESYRCTFGDGLTGTGRSISYAYKHSGTFIVTLTVTDDGGATDSTSKLVTVRQPDKPPVANFTWQALSTSGTRLLVEPRIGDQVQFDASGASDSDGEIVSWHWDFGDGAASPERNPTHYYKQEGTFTVTLTVTDNDGLTGQTAQAIVIEHKDLIQADFTFHVVDEALHKIHLDASASIDTMGTIVRYEWDWDGDGIYDTAVQTPEMMHRFDGEGPYQVILTIVDDQGNRASCTKEVGS